MRTAHEERDGAVVPLPKKDVALEVGVHGVRGLPVKLQRVRQPDVARQLEVEAEVLVGVGDDGVDVGLRQEPVPGGARGGSEEGDLWVGTPQRLPPFLAADLEGAGALQGLGQPVLLGEDGEVEPATLGRRHCEDGLVADDPEHDAALQDVRAHALVLGFQRVAEAQQVRDAEGDVGHAGLRHLLAVVVGGQLQAVVEEGRLEDGQVDELGQRDGALQQLVAVREKDKENSGFTTAGTATTTTTAAATTATTTTTTTTTPLRAQVVSAGATQVS